MNKLRLLLVVSLLGLFAGGTVVVAAPGGRGEAALREAFDPDRIFKGELEDSSENQLILTVWASSRDDWAPGYSLAIAYRCVRTENPRGARCGFIARTLRTGATNEARFGPSLELAGKARRAESASEMNGWLDKAHLQWLEADVEACPKGIFAMDSIRIADWRPDIHYALQEPKDRELIVHPAAIRVRMSGSYSTSRYEGWVLAPGVPAAVAKLLVTLEPCWKPVTAPLPWKRR